MFETYLSPWGKGGEVGNPGTIATHVLLQLIAQHIGTFVGTIL